jgi:hypothetical protein
MKDMPRLVVGCIQCNVQAPSLRSLCWVSVRHRLPDPRKQSGSCRPPAFGSCSVGGLGTGLILKGGLRGQSQNAIFPSLN